MDSISTRILKELLPVEKEIPVRAAAKSERQNGVDHWTTPILLERAAYLSKLAKYGDGSASETIKEYARHSVMLSFRSRDGEAEVHENFADIFFVIDGSATLVTGGTVSGAKSAGPGEIRGTSLAGGVRHQLRAGDVAHVPAGQPHQMLVGGGKTISCLVLKVQENA